VAIWLGRTAAELKPESGWVKGQEAHIVRLADGVYKVSWDEPTGTTVSVAVKKKTVGIGIGSKA
jgi:phenolic acid decarboxylase